MYMHVHCAVGIKKGKISFYQLNMQETYMHYLYKKTLTEEHLVNHANVFKVLVDYYMWN